jgi:hypothetical protein
MNNIWRAILPYGKLVIAAILLAAVAAIAGVTAIGSPQQSLVISAAAAAISALFTAFTAFATMQLAVESQKHRDEQERQRKELAFQAVIVEMASYIGHFNRWHPANNSDFWVDEIWWMYPMRFNRLTELMEAVRLHPKLWERIVGGSLVAIQWLEKHLNDFRETRKRNVAVKAPINEYFVLDLYLKQLARYVVCEMQRQNQPVPQGVRETKFFQPLAWNYDRLPDSPKEAAQIIESKFMPPGLPEIDDFSFHECQLEVLINEARKAFHEAEQNKKAN